MKIVLYTQRVEIVEHYGERRDCADQHIPLFLEKCGFLPVALPNISSIAKEMVHQLKPAGIVLTGGNSLVRYGGEAFERDEMEHSLLKLAFEQNLPVFGFCRGMQVILDHFNCKLENVKDHVAVRHVIQGKLGTFEVNSYHNQACFDAGPSLDVLARTHDGVIEAVAAKQKKALAVMWHPEREPKFLRKDIQLIQDLFRKEDK